MTKYLRFLCKFTIWSCGCIEKQIRCWKNCWYSYNIDKCNKIWCLSSRNMIIDKTMCEVLWRNISDFYVNLRVEVAAVSRNRKGVEKTVDTHTILINAIQFYVCLQKYDRQNHVWRFMTKYLRFLCKFTSWSGETPTGIDLSLDFPFVRLFGVR